MSCSKLPEMVICNLTKEGSPIANLMIMIELSTLRKNHYTIVFGPTDVNGNAILSAEEIKRQANSQLQLALMDYDPIEESFVGLMRVKIMTHSDIKNAIAAYDLFKSEAYYPHHYRDALDSVIRTLDQIDVSRICISVKVVPTSSDIRVIVEAMI